MVKGRLNRCPVRYRAERRPDRPADIEDTYGGYDMHSTLCAALCPLQNVIPMLQIGFSGALKLIPTHFLRLPSIESAEETVCASRNASAVLSFAAHHCREQARLFRLFSGALLHLRIRLLRLPDRWVQAKPLHMETM